MASKKSIAGLLLLVTLLVAAIAAAGCVNTEQTADDRPAAVCTNGVFVGTHEKETGVITFKGIPFAKQPVGDLRWKAPQEPEYLGDTPYEATELGHTALQPASQGEYASMNPQGEDCLTLNVWTQDLEKPGKIVMVFIHGGGYMAGGSSDPGYNGQYLAAKDDDIIVVTFNYRINTMGFIDFSDVEGGEEFPDAPNLGLLDCIAALKWVQENIESFGGKPE